MGISPPEQTETILKEISCPTQEAQHSPVCGEGRSPCYAFFFKNSLTGQTLAINSPESIPWPGGPRGSGGDGQGGHLLGEVIGLLGLLVEGLGIADEEGQQLADFLAQG